MKNLLFGILALISFSCSTSNNDLLKSTESFEIIFSNTGGFTNFTTGKVFRSSGKVEYFNGPNLSSVKTIKNYDISTDQVNNIYSLVNSIKLEELELHEKGNITYVLKIKLDKNEKTISWKDQELSSSLPKEIRDLIIYLNSL